MRHEQIDRAGLNEAIGVNLPVARRSRSLPLTVVATRAGVSIATLSRIENGKQPIDAALLIVLAHVIDVPPVVLLGADEMSLHSEAVTAALTKMIPAERRRVVRAAEQRRLKNTTPSEALDDVAEHISAAAEQLLSIKRKITRRR